MTRFTVGDEVYARPRDGRIGTFAERIAVDEDDLAIKPTNLSMAEAASVPLVALTAWQALVERANPQPGQKVLIHAGSGGVGTYAIQLAKHLRATVTTTTGTSNVEWVRDLGADVVIDYRTQNFETVAHDYDIVLDSQGGETLAKSLLVLKPGGTAISIAGPPDPDFAGTDREIAVDGYGVPPPGEERLVLGHESLGEVIDAPADSGLAPGDRVAGVVRRPDPVPCTRWVGIDLHRRRSQIAIIDEHGELSLSRRIVNDPDTFQELLGDPGSAHLALEATYGWEWLAELLDEAGYDVHLAHPLRTRAIAAAKVKTDAVDPKTLAHLAANRTAARGVYRAARTARPA